MNALTTAAIVLACVFGGALIGMFLGSRLPRHHLTSDSKEVVKLGIGVVATMAALVLGLLVSTAKGSFDKMDNELTLLGANAIQFDRTLAQYGPETNEIRNHLRKQYQAIVDALFSKDESQLARLSGSGTHSVITEDVHAGLDALVPRSDAQRSLLSRALALSGDVAAIRWLLVLQDRDTISTPLLAVVVAWLTLIFLGFGLLSPRNETVTGVLFMCALCTSGAIFLILEMERPLDGMIRISDAPMRAALAILLAN